MRAARAAALASLLALAACAHRGPPPEEPAPPPHRTATVPEPPDQVEEPPPRPPPDEDGARAGAEVGIASYYGARFHGRKTASGARYDMHAMTCAHRTLPFGTRVRVTDLESGRSVDVTVTDRGPFARGRIVDLSLAAARRLGMVAKGLVRVRLERLGAPPDDDAGEDRED